MSRDAWQAYEAAKRVIAALGLPPERYEQRIAMLECALGEALEEQVEGCCCYELVGDNELCGVHPYQGRLTSSHG